LNVHPLSAILQTELVGRTTRKLVHIASRIVRFLSMVLKEATENHPYVVKLKTRPRRERLEVAAKYYSSLRHVAETLEQTPKISVLIPVYRTPLSYLREALDSVTRQAYANWEICAVDDCSGDPAIMAVLEEYATKFPGKVHYRSNARNMHISATSNACLALATGEYVALLDHDDRIYPNALAEVVRYINLFDGPDILYSDDRTIDSRGECSNITYFKPGWSPYMHLCMNYTCHLAVFRTTLLREIGGFRPGFEGSQDHDLMLRAVESAATPAVVHIPLCLYQWRAHAQSTATNLEAKPYAVTAGERAVTEALQRRAKPGDVSFDTLTKHYRIRFNLPGPAPLVSIVIPSKNSYAILSQCLESIISRSTYKHFEIIISDNGSDQRQVLDYYGQLGTRLPDRFTVLRKQAPFNFARQVNEAIEHARGEFCLILNNDTEVITPDWIEELLMLCQFPDVGAVGCKLLYPDDTIQHAGIMNAGRNLGHHAGHLREQDYNGYLGHLNTLHEVFAVTAACMMVKKADWRQAGGFDEKYLANGYGDLEFCIKLNGIGKSCVYTPWARLYHHESKTRGKNIEYFERHHMMRVYGQQLLYEKHLNPNLKFTSLYDIDDFYAGLDLNNTEFKYFLDTPPEKWLSEIDRLPGLI
jgi:glycosyltransferase involved in cell wall biosynthesis